MAVHMYFWVWMFMARDYEAGLGHAVQPVKGSRLAEQFTFKENVVFVIKRIRNNENTSVWNFFISVVIWFFKLENLYFLIMNEILFVTIYFVISFLPCFLFIIFCIQILKSK